MAFVILDATTRSAVAAATTQTAERDAMLAPWAGGGVRMRVLGTGGVLRQTQTLGAWVTGGTNPLTFSPGARSAWTHSSTGDIERLEFRTLAETPIFSIDAQAGAGAAAVDFVGVIKERCPVKVSPLVFTADDALPVIGLPSWMPAVGAVAEISSGTTIGSAVRAMGGNSYGGTDPDDIVDPWSGGALVYVSGQPYLVVMGGGHGDSAFNGIVKFGPLFGAGSNTPTWSSFLAASAVGDVRDDFTYLDGRQTSTHSYNNIVGVGDTLYSVRTDGNYSTGNSSTLGFKFTPAGQTAIASYAGASGNQFCATAHYDGRIYAIGANGQFDQLRIYNIAGNSYTTEGNAAIAFNNYPGGAVDSGRGKLLVIAGLGGGPLTSSAYWDLGTLNRQLDVNRPPGWIYSLMFDPDRDAFVSMQSGSLVVQEASASALAAGSGATWTTRTFTGPTLPATPPNGQYGRTQYVPELKGYVHAPGLESSVYFFRSA